MHKHTRRCRRHDVTCETHVEMHTSANATGCGHNCSADDTCRTTEVTEMMFSTHYITDFWLGKWFWICPCSPTCNSRSGWAVLFCYSQNYWEIHYAASWRTVALVYYHLRQTESWQSYTYPVTCHFMHIHIKYALNCATDSMHMHAKYTLDLHACVNDSVWPLLCKTSLLFLRWASVCAHA